jgi:hypothetical protein
VKTFKKGTGLIFLASATALVVRFVFLQNNRDKLKQTITSSPTERWKMNTKQKAGYSSDSIDIKFSSSTDISKSENLLPSSLMKSVSSIVPLFSLSDEQLQRIDASELKLWMRITLKPNVNSQIFLKELLSLPNVDTADFTSLPAPPPSN